MNIGLLIVGIGGCIGMLCSLLTLWIIYRRKYWNGYIQIIWLLALSQLFYDLSTVMVMFSGYTIEYIYIALRSMSGLWATFLTNILSYVIVYTVWTLQPIEILSYMVMIRIGVFGPATILGLLVPMTMYSSSKLAFNIISEIYFWTRIISIIFNILSYFILVYKLKSVLKWTNKSTSNVIQKNIYRDGNPLSALVRRFKYYPIIQVLSRICVAYNEQIYGHDYKYYNSFTLQHKISQILYLLTLPSAGLGFFIVFLVVSPGATKLLIDDWKSFITKIFCDDFALRIFQTFRRHSSTYQDGDPIFPAPPESGGQNNQSGSSRPSQSHSTHSSYSQSRQSWHENTNSDRILSTDYQRNLTLNYYDELDEDELTNEITRMYSSSSSGVRHYSLQESSYGSSGAKNSESSANSNNTNNNNDNNQDSSGNSIGKPNNSSRHIKSFINERLLNFSGDIDEK